MCGLVAVMAIGERTRPAVNLNAMLQALVHRGPDDSGEFQAGQVALGFRRLAILDLSVAGHQPMSTADGMLTIVFNGEIFNFVELRRELESFGHRFSSTGDTEVLLRAYLQWGEHCLARLNGMWAFIIFDARDGSLFGSRDRFGIKPLFRSQDGDHILFASEIKAILAAGARKTIVNWTVASSYLVHGRLDETDETFYSGIDKVPAGHAFRVDASGAYRHWPYWTIEAAEFSSSDDPSWAFAELFEDAVRLHMRSDVPVGIHLSGGLDSTSIACASARVRRQSGAKGPLSVFSYIAPEFDESQYIRATVRETGATSIELKTTAERLWADLERMLWFQDEPVHSLTALVSFQLMRATASHGIKVVLNGQGADETLAGYTNYFQNYWYGIAESGGLLAAWREAASYADVHRASAARLLGQLIMRRAFEVLARRSTYRALTAGSRRRLLRGGWLSEDVLRELPPPIPPIPPELNGALVYSQRVAPLPLYLRIEDRNSMAFSIEARLPFLDFRLAEFAYALPDAWKLRGPWNKYILREAMRGRIPESIRTRPDKMGFPVPAKQWFAEQLLEPVSDLIGSRKTVESGRYRIDTVKRDLERHRKGAANFTDQLFSVAQFELWSNSLEQPRVDTIERITTPAFGSATL